jgi:hypothetical protein
MSPIASLKRLVLPSEALLAMLVGLVLVECRDTRRPERAVARRARVSTPCPSAAERSVSKPEQVCSS